MRSRNSSRSPVAVKQKPSIQAEISKTDIYTIFVILLMAKPTEKDSPDFIKHFIDMLNDVISNEKPSQKGSTARPFLDSTTNKLKNPMEEFEKYISTIDESTPKEDKELYTLCLQLVLVHYFIIQIASIAREENKYAELCNYPTFQRLLDNMAAKIENSSIHITYEQSKTESTIVRYNPTLNQKLSMMLYSARHFVMLMLVISGFYKYSVSASFIKEHIRNNPHNWLTARELTAENFERMIQNHQNAALFSTAIHTLIITSITLGIIYSLLLLLKSAYENADNHTRQTITTFSEIKEAFKPELPADGKESSEKTITHFFRATQTQDNRKHESEFAAFLRGQIKQTKRFGS